MTWAQSLSRLLAVAVASVILGFAPLYHAACVVLGSPTISSTSATTMTMPDGSVMVHSSVSQMEGATSSTSRDALMATASASVTPTSPTPIATPTSLTPTSMPLSMAESLGVVLVSVGIAVLTMVLWTWRRRLQKLWRNLSNLVPHAVYRDTVPVPRTLGPPGSNVRAVLGVWRW